MKFTFSLLFFLCIQIVAFPISEEWGQTGHRVVGEVASNHLTKKAKKEIDQLLNGLSLAVVSTYADEIKSDRKFNEYRPWHYVNIPFDKNYSDINPKEEGDIIQAIEKCIAVLKDDTASRDNKAFHLKLLVHFMGDLHQPMHLGLEEDKGGNDFQVRWFNEGTNLHRVWDSNMIDSYQMTYSELAGNLPPLSKKQVLDIQKGHLLDWVLEERELTKKIYQSAEVGEKLGYRYMYDHFKTVKIQLQKGGLRLAKILNELFA
ncbi:S1/P1 nuclease [Planktosalinus lacus]|uniref:Endonuclease n=1 Tax=Planktosalinus lacus TaxID=1526573 RepID=A0A8J2V8L9_9FLAO|nr:S1/P1 nuclease [Planktosalinus lacus]GGD88643.1 endonuclease [Planktosalinus lacus]